ncbi:MAG: FAD-dependent oxidoreductase [Burkholderiales bacterium]|nr:FAD-dependent oxidoreductase [Burkholderiales bacterium]
MKIAVVGAGVIGLTSAYELALDGHSVSIFEQASSAATASSFANAGLLSPSLTQYLSLPAWPPTGWLARAMTLHALKIGPRVSWEDLRWLGNWRKRISPETLLQNAQVAHTLIEAGKQRVHAIAANEKFEFERTEGQLILVNNEARLIQLRDKLTTLKSWGVVASEISPEDVQKFEPGFNAPATLHRAIHIPEDEVGNCRQFALGVKKALQAMDVQFHFDTTVANIQSALKPRIYIRGSTQFHEFDHVVVCTGTRTHTLTQSFKIPMPMASIASYSLTARVKEEINAPRSALHDAHHHTSIVRMGKRIRVSCGAELGTVLSSRNAGTTRHLYRVLQEMFPGGADYSGSVQVWKGTMAVTADGLPIIGPSSQNGVWLNLGHGPNGWGMACGSAMCIAAAIGGRSSIVDLKKVSPLR